MYFSALTSINTPASSRKPGCMCSLHCFTSPLVESLLFLVAFGLDIAIQTVRMLCPGPADTARSKVYLVHSAAAVLGMSVYKRVLLSSIFYETS